MIRYMVLSNHLRLIKWVGWGKQSVGKEAENKGMAEVKLTGSV